MSRVYASKSADPFHQKWIRNPPCISGRESGDARSLAINEVSSGREWQGAYLDAVTCSWKTGKNPLETNKAIERCAFFTADGNVLTTAPCPAPDTECMKHIDGHCVTGEGCGTGDMCPCSWQSGDSEGEKRCTEVCSHFHAREECSYWWVDHQGKDHEETTCDDYTGKPKPCKLWK